MDPIKEAVGKKQEFSVPSTSEYIRFFRKKRFRCSVISDKTRYKSGETVYIKGIILDAFNKTPVGSEDLDLLGDIEITIKNSKEETIVVTSSEIDEQSCVGCEWVISSDAKGGEYFVRIQQKDGKGLAISEMKFDILKYTPPKFKKEIVFFQNGYSEGDTVMAHLLLERSEGGFCDTEKTNIDVIARIDGSEVFKKTGLKLSKEGKCFTSFKLPKTIENGVGSLNFIVTEGTTESKSKTLPIILKTLKCFVYPEGGELICGVPNGVYCAAFTPTEEPADFVGVLIGRKGKGKWEKIKRVKSLHEGRAYFDFIPEKGKEYALKILHPTGVKKFVEMPNVKLGGVGIYLKKKNVKRKFGEDVEVLIFTSKKRKILVGMFKREKAVCFVEVEVEKNVATLVKLNPKENDGVLRITVFDKKKLPLSERLVFVSQKEEIKIQVETDRKTYSPGDRVKLRISSRNEKGEKISSTCSICVTDDSVRKMTEKRRRAARLPSVYFLKDEVQELFDPQSYLVFDEQDIKKVEPEVKMDLLLGTQGWRRFVYKKLENEHDVLEWIETHSKLFCVNDDAVTMNEVLDTYSFTGEPLYSVDEFDRTIVMVNGSGMMRCGLGGDDQPLAEFPSIFFSRGIMVGMGGSGPMPQIDRGITPQKLNISKVGILRAGSTKEKKTFRKRGKAEKGDVGKDREEGGIIGCVREYAHKVRDDRKVGERVDFTETLYSDMRGCKGEVEIEFDLNDAVSSFCVLIDAFTENGLIGASETYIVNSVKPFYVEGKIPLELTFGDEVLLPVGIFSNLEKEIKCDICVMGSAGLKVTRPKIESGLKAKERIAKYVNVKAVTTTQSRNWLKISAHVKNYDLVDDVKKDVENYSGMMNGRERFTFDFPKDYVVGSIKTSTIIYPSPMANFNQSLRKMIREPYGCFEQTSRTLYPMILAVSYMKNDPKTTDIKLLRKANKFIKAGYKKLIGYECKTGGFSLFGGGRGNMGLTSMGLLEFVEMQNVYPIVDQKMVERTREWILSRRGNQGFEYATTYYYGNASKSTMNAYISYACSKAGVVYHDLASIILNLEKEALKVSVNTDTYFIGLVALTLHHHQKAKRSCELVKKLAKAQNKKGIVNLSKETIMHSMGMNKDIETTSFAILNFLNFQEFYENATRGVKWLYSCCEDGGFGTTQSTVLALEAIVKFEKVFSKPMKGKNFVKLSVNGKKVDEVSFNETLVAAQTMKDFSQSVVGGKKNVIDVEIKSKKQMPFSINLSYTSPNPVQVKHKYISFKNKLMKKKLNEGEITEVEVELVNKVDEELPMTICIISLPSGLQPKFDRLKELKKTDVVDHFELFSAREVVFYCQTLKRKKKFLFFVEAVIPGKFRAQASRAYLYYGAGTKLYVKGLEVEIFPKK